MVLLDICRLTNCMKLVKPNKLKTIMNDCCVTQNTQKLILYVPFGLQVVIVPSAVLNVGKLMTPNNLKSIITNCSLHQRNLNISF